MSLQLRGVPPSDDEYAVLDALDDVPESMVDAWLNSPEFAAQVVRFHQGLLWNRLDVQLINAGFSLRREGGSLLYWRLQTGTTYRGAAVACMDTPATYDPVTGAIMTQEIDGVHYEGYRLITPYWAPETTIKVCAFDAQEAEVGLSGLPVTPSLADKTRAAGVARTCATAVTGVHITRSSMRWAKMSTCVSRR